MINDDADTLLDDSQATWKFNSLDYDILNYEPDFCFVFLFSVVSRSSMALSRKRDYFQVPLKNFKICPPCFMLEPLLCLFNPSENVKFTYLNKRLHEAPNQCCERENSKIKRSKPSRHCFASLIFHALWCNQSLDFSQEDQGFSDYSSTFLFTKWWN